MSTHRLPVVLSSLACCLHPAATRTGAPTPAAEAAAGAATVGAPAAEALTPAGEPAAERTDCKTFRQVVAETPAFTPPDTMVRGLAVTWLPSRAPCVGAKCTVASLLAPCTCSSCGQPRHVLLRSAGGSLHPSASTSLTCLSGVCLTFPSRYLPPLAAQGEIEDLIPFNSSLVLREWPEGGSRATCVCSTVA